MTIRLRAVACALVAATVIALSGCTPTGAAASIALLLPESKTARYESNDRPVFEAEVARLGGGRVLYSNADQDPAKQQAQAEAALAQGVKVLVLDPVDAEAAISIVQAANAQGVPVIAYDRLPAGGKIAYYVSFDNDHIGQQQATAFVAGVEAAGPGRGILMLNGAPTDPNAAQFKAGAHEIIDGSGLEVLAEYDTPDWSPDQAQAWVAGQITQFGSRISGIYAGNDGTAGGAIAALKAADVDPLPVVSGQDAELAGIQRIVAGDQFLTIYKAMREQATLAAQAAVDLVDGQPVDAETTEDGIPTTLLPAQVVTVDTIASTVVADGVFTIDQICTPQYAAACTRVGLTGG